MRDIREKGLGVAINDFNQDEWPDIAVANDSFPSNFFGTMATVPSPMRRSDLALAYDSDGIVFAGMGVDIAGYDNDGWPDLFINALARQRYALFRNDHGKSSEYVTSSTGLGAISLMHSVWVRTF